MPDYYGICVRRGSGGGGEGNEGRSSMTESMAVAKKYRSAKYRNGTPKLHLARLPMQLCVLDLVGWHERAILACWVALSLTD